MVIPNFTGALCTDDAAVFTSTDENDHAEAAAICRSGCPVFAACAGMARGLQRGALDHRPVGTWGGELYGTTKRTHGTEAGWRQHKHYREKACGGCRLAHEAQVRARNRTPIRGKMEAAQTGERELTNLGLAPVLSKQNERLTAS